MNDYSQDKILVLDRPDGSDYEPHCGRSIDYCFVPDGERDNFYKSEAWKCIFPMLFPNQGQLFFYDKKEERKLNMKKSDQKIKTRQLKHSEAQKKHQSRVSLDLKAREEKERVLYEKKNSTVEVIDRDIREERNRDQLKRNMEILAFLEGELEKEEAKKEQVNHNLEEQGFFTLEDKVKHLSETSKIASVGGSAECTFTCNAGSHDQNSPLENV